MTSISTILALLFVASPAATPAAKPAATGTPAKPANARAVPLRRGIPKLAPGQVWISSIPVGLEVRQGDRPMTGKVLGRTPIVVDTPVRPAHLTVVLPTKEGGGALPSQAELIDFTAHVTHSTQLGKEDLSRAITYRFETGSRPTAIALFQSRNASLSDWAKQYPRGINFRFADGDVRKELAAKRVPAGFVALGIELLHRGGKIALPAANGWIIAQVTPTGRVEIADAPK